MSMNGLNLTDAIKKDIRLPFFKNMKIRQLKKIETKNFTALGRSQTKV